MIGAVQIAADGYGMAQAPMRRVFLLGCPRSGTTFLQAALSSHPDVASIPETAFFERALPDRLLRAVAGPQAVPRRRRVREYLRTQKRTRRTLHRLARDIGVPRGTIGLHSSLAGYVGTFTRLLDAMARERSCTAWLEKTPNHVFYLDFIENHVPDVRVIHLLRRGEDVVASAVEASLLYDKASDGTAFNHGIPWWVSYWNAAVDAHRRYAWRDNHCVVFYEDLVRDFAGEYARLCRFIGVAPMRARLAASDRIASVEEEPWKRSALSGRLLPASPKFDALFGPAARDWIRSQLLPYEEIRASLRAPQAPLAE